MTSYGAPKCYTCTKIMSFPRSVGDKAFCKDYDAVPESIFFRAGECNKHIEDKDKSGRQ